MSICLSGIKLVNTEPEMRVKDIFGGIPIFYMYIHQSISLYIIIIINLLFINYYTLLLEVGYPSGYIVVIVYVCG